MTETLSNLLHLTEENWMIAKVVIEQRSVSAETAIAIIVFILELCLIHKGFLLPQTSRSITQAERAGRTAQGRLIDQTQRHQKDPNTGKLKTVYFGKYTYTVHGCQHSYSHYFDAPPPNILSLYYRKNPARAFSCYNAVGRTSKVRTLVVIALPFVAARVVHILLH